MAIRTVVRRGERRLVIDFFFRDSSGSKQRYRKDAEVQTLASARAEERRRLAAVATKGSPYAILDETAAKLEAEHAPAPVVLTFAEVAARYLAEFAPSHLRPSTKANYVSVVKAWLVPFFGKRPLAAIDAKMVREFDTILVGNPMGFGTRRYILCVLRSIVCKYAVEAELLDKAPKLPPLPRVRQTIVSVLTPSELATVIDNGSIRREHRLAFLLSAHAGLRRGEIRALRCGDVELANNRLVVRTAICRGVEGPPKSGDHREVPLTMTLREALILAGVDTRDPNERAALTTRGKPWAASGLNLAFGDSLKRAGLRHCRLHSLRHFFVTALLNAGVATHVVRELAGHSDLSTTQRYAHTTIADRGAALVALDSVCMKARAKAA